MDLMNIFVGIATTILGVILTIIVDRIFGTKEYKDRIAASNKMLQDMVKSSKMYFVGITHEKIVSHLKRAIEMSSNRNPLGWEEIHFFYPTSDYGICWDKNFNKKMNLSILNISNYLLNEVNIKLPHLHVYFYLNSSGINFGGSLFQYRKSKKYFNVIYDVYQSRSISKEQENAKTIRLNNRLGHKVFFERLLSSFEEIKSDAQIIYEIDCNENNYWNTSPAAWDRYEQTEFSPHMQSMHYLSKEIDTIYAKNILSLGAGTGEFENILLNKRNYKGFLGLADKSYSMLFRAYKKLGRHENACFALLDLSKEWTLYGELAERKYDYIIIHFSVHHFIGENQSISDFARRLRNILELNGKIIIAIHDNIYSPPDNNESLRSFILEFAERHKVENRLNDRRANNTISINELRTGFANNGLFVVREAEKVIARNIRERVEMWKVDAILDSLIDFSALIKYKSELYAEMCTLQNKDTEPMKVKYIEFSETMNIIVVSVILLNHKNEVLTVVKNGCYLLPGGKMRPNEKEDETLKRELMEELSIDPKNLIIIEKIGTFEYMKAFIEDAPLQMNVYRCEIDPDATASLKARNEITKFEWINLHKLSTYENMPKEYFQKIFDEANILLS